MSEPCAPTVPVPVDTVRAAVRADMPRTLEQLVELVAIPGIAWESFDAAQLERSAVAVAGVLADAGLEEVEILRVPLGDGPGHPAVVAHRRPAPGRPTVLLYAHHDVQPPGRRELWDSEPFVAEERDGRLYGRGAADDKAGVMAHAAALRAATAHRGDDFGLGVTVFVEGEEEAGSPSFRDFLEAHRERLAADVIVIADSANWEVGVPALTTSLRGMVGAVVELSVLEHAVHSGMYGGPVLDAPTLLARLIATLHDDDGAVAVEGLLAEDRTDLVYDEERFRADAAVLKGVRLAGRGSIASRLWTQPALSVTGMDVTPVDTAANTIAASARAKLSLRTAPGQDPAEAAEALRRHVEEHAPFGAHVRIELEETGQSFRTDMSSESARIARWALGEAWGRPAVETGIGGSIPFTADLLEVYPEAGILITGVEDPDSRAHSANESLHLAEFERAVVAETLMLLALDDAARPGRRIRE
ncbi:dipeptidase [Kocuria rosea]|uniref:dipeptidase n=1 Tax=Kocuria rosea TaxID=1275 RepID=UPI000F6BB5A6|nr:dipeptidase [Kocuria rosea]MEB2528741.1 dipeptidase [Kocuria rosea]MEB2620394.1 dipeptidase [Kocuria rosea]WJZ64985.1 dipeptidase [Kocuria rosea]VEI49789.1 Succinyl-diaminopimelate desuccinylase [Kocuria rosea]